jgi:V/A-type H+-transporting ATPase subunit I
MKKTTLVVHQNYVEDVIKNLHESSMMEIIDISKEDPETLKTTESATIHPDAETCTTYVLRLSRLIDILKKITPMKSGLKAILHPELPEIKVVEDRNLDEIYSYSEGILSEIERKILERDQKLQELNEKIEIFNHDIEQLNYIKDFEFDISDIGESNYLFIKVGKTTELDALNTKIKAMEKSIIFSQQFGSGKKIEWAVLITAHISEKDKIEKICKENITEFDLDVSSGSPKELLTLLQQDKKEIEKAKKKIISELRIFAKEQLEDLFALREEIQLERIKKEVPKNFAKTSSTYIIKGWVLEKNENTLKESVVDVSKGYVSCNFETPSTNPDNPPVSLDTPKWAKPFRTFLDMFATPKYNEIDPMVFMGIFFVLFFGIMLGDAGYGLILLLLSVFGYIKFSKYSETIKNWSFMGIWLGLTTIVVGVLTNSFFGDLIQRFVFHNPNQQLYSLTLLGVHLPIEPLRNPLIILVIALIFGLMHLNLGILLAIYQSYKNKDFKSLITKHLSWIPLQIGGGLLIGSFLLHLWSLGTLEFYFSIIFMIIGLILRLIHAGPLGFFDITGYIGDWLSYARLLALGLGTTGMALAFNIVAEIIPQMIPVVGIILTPIILVFAHMANLGLQTLGAGVHSLRLQYVEFFNRFYEGGGKKFEPFSIKRKYTKIKEVE